MLKHDEAICPICLGRSKLVHKGTRDDQNIDVYQCSTCGTKFLSVVDRQNDYESGFMYETNQLSDLNIEERLRLFSIDDMRRCEMVKDKCRGKRILDFGCGFGGFLHYISEVTDLYCGVELGKQERDYLNGKGVSCFKDIEECKGKFDVITLFHVFEHLNNPRMWLDKLADYLVKDGYLIIEVPNANDILLCLYENEAFADFTYWSAHLFLYTMKSLSMLINECGKYNILSAEQVQRYPITNHLMWLAKGKPGGHNSWKFLDSDNLDRAYEAKLAELEMCDTLFFILQVK